MKKLTILLCSLLCLTTLAGCGSPSGGVSSWVESSASQPTAQPAQSVPDASLPDVSVPPEDSSQPEEEPAASEPQSARSTPEPAVTAPETKPESAPEPAVTAPETKPETKPEPAGSTPESAPPSWCTRSRAGTPTRNARRHQGDRLRLHRAQRLQPDRRHWFPLRQRLHPQLPGGRRGWRAVL